MTKTDCGCGGAATPSGPRTATRRPAGGGAATGGCACGGSGAGSCGGHAGTGGYTRPRFFSGMLLTEDDLQAIDDYALAKRRLTNRHMFGSGVVCGLEIDCDPCRPGWLTVTSGYALDCCGNDIVVGCPERLDALVLLDELRRRSGSDCGEPCDEKPRSDYLLVVRYDEQPEEPVAPYSRDDCAVGECEFSRVREGYRFELVCELGGAEPSLFDRMEECLGSDDEPTRENTEMLTRLMRFASTQARADAAEETGELPKPEIPTAKEYEAAQRDLAVGPALDLIRRSTSALTAEAARPAGAPQLFHGRQRDLLVRRRAELARTLKDSPALEELPPADRDRAMRIIGQVDQDPATIAGLGVAERVWLTEGLDPVEAQDAYIREAERFRTNFIREIDQRGKGNCEERQVVGKLPLDRLDKYSRSNIETLARIYLRYVGGCLCDLVNPPCPTCTEQRVPLARVSIEDCRVVEVCNLTRQWVLAPRTLNYWFPFVDVVRDLLIGRCCGDIRREPKSRPSGDDERQMLVERGQKALKMMRSVQDAPAFREMLRVLDEPVAASPLGQPVAAAQPAPAPAGGPSAGPPTVQELEAKLLEVSEQLKQLRGVRP